MAPTGPRGGSKSRRRNWDWTAFLHRSVRRNGPLLLRPALMILFCVSSSHQHRKPFTEHSTLLPDYWENAVMVVLTKVSLSQFRIRVKATFRREGNITPQKIWMKQKFSSSGLQPCLSSPFGLEQQTCAGLKSTGNSTYYYHGPKQRINSNQSFTV